jgi:hypothetical protein
VEGSSDRRELGLPVVGFVIEPLEEADPTNR